MEYSALVEVYEALGETQSRLEKTAILASAMSDVEQDLLVPVTRLLRGTVFEPWEPGDIGISSSLAHEAISRATGVEESEIEVWWREAGDIGDAAATATEQSTQTTLVAHTLTVSTVHDTLRSLAEIDGAGSQDRRVGELAGLLADADPLDAKYLVRTVTGAMRLGIGEGLVRDAIAEAFLDGTDAAVAAVQRAYEVTNDFSIVASRARADGTTGLATLQMELFRPIKPMLAQRSDDLESALTSLGDEEGSALLEVKYDGMRVKLHRDGDRIRIYTRRLEDVSKQFPEVIDAGAGLDADRYVIEAEIVGYDDERNEPVPFQELSRRIKRKHDIRAMAEAVPVGVYAFDMLYGSDGPMLEHPLRDRVAALESVLPSDGSVIERAGNRLTGDREVAEAFRQEALAAGHEGLMVKNLTATYQPGSRVGFQQKVKETLEPLDLVVTRAKWSEGRKQGFLGRPYLAARDADGGLLEVGRMHSGFTDEQLAEFTELVEPLIESVEGREATFRPEVVLEVECAEIQRSPTYDSGYALRFPRLKRIRSDLGPGDADSIERIRDLYDE